MNDNMSLSELKELEEVYREKARKIDVAVIETIEAWIESISGINVVLSRGSVRPCSRIFRSGKSKYCLEYVDVKLVNDEGKEMFGADFTLSWYGDLITINTGSCGEFVVLGEQKEHDKYQVLKYKLMGIVMQYAEELNNRLNIFDFSDIGEYYNIRTKVSHLEWEETQRQRANERKVLLDSIKVGKTYLDNSLNNKKTVTKITDKRVYFDVIYNSGYTVQNKYYSKEDVIYNLKHNIYEEILYV